MNLHKQTIIAFSIKVITTLAAFGYNWLLSRLLGAKGLGAYQLAYTVSAIGIVLAGLGFNYSILRLISANIALEKFSLAKGYYKKAFQFVLVAALIVTAGIYVFAKPFFITFYLEKENLIPLVIIMSCIIVPSSLNNLLADVLKAFGYFQISLFIQNGFVPLIGSIGLIIHWLLYSKVYVTHATYIYILTIWFVFIVSIFLFLKNIPSTLKGVSALYDEKILLKTTMPLWTVMIFLTIMESLDILLIGMWVGIKEAGIYAIAKKISSLNGFFLASTNTVAAPQFATLYAQNKNEDLKVLAQKSTKLLFWTGLLVCSLISIFSTPFLSIFGEEFKEGWILLVILSIGQFINVAVGPVAYLLIMTGHQSEYRTNMIIASVISVALYFVLIPTFSITGAAIASAIGLIFENIRGVWLVRQKLGFNTLSNHVIS